jgi:protein-S-isoprenylcysteine O-methyltransferase Ste14
MWIVIICLAYLFGISETILAFTKRSKKKTVKIKKDRGSLIIMYVVFTISMTAGFFLADFRSQTSLHYIMISLGLIIYLLGLLIRWTSIIQLKKAFTVDVAIVQEHELKTDGLYKIIKHPAYLGLFMIFLGLSISMNNLLSVLVIAIPVFLAIAYRIKVEEAVLIEEFGSKYKEYSESTKRIIPFVY